VTAPLGLGELLLEEGLCDEATLLAAQRYARRQRCALVTALVEEGRLGEDDVLSAIERRLAPSRADLSPSALDLDALRALPLELIERCVALPLSVEQTDTRPILRVAMADPLDRESIDELEKESGACVEVLVAPFSEITRAIQKHARGLVTKQIRPFGSTPTPRVRHGAETPVPETVLKPVPSTQPHHRLEDEATPEVKLRALLSALYAKNVLSEEDFLKQLRKLLRGDGE
jgi:hypothetical protein